MSLLLILRSPSNYVISAAVGVFTLTGSDTSITQQKRLHTATATFNATPISAGFVRDEKIIVAEGKFLIIGSDVGLLKNSYLQPISVNYHTALSNAYFAKNTVLQADVGSYNLSGNNANFIAGKPDTIQPIPIFGGAGVGLGFAEQKVDSNVDFREKDEQDIIDIIKIFLRCQ